MCHSPTTSPSDKPDKDIYLCPDGNLKRGPCLGMKDEIGGMLPFVGDQVGLRVELVEEDRVCQVEVRVGDIGGGCVLAVGARRHVEQAVGQVHVDCVLQGVELGRICGAILLAGAVYREIN